MLTAEQYHQEAQDYGFYSYAEDRMQREGVTWDQIVEERFVRELNDEFRAFAKAGAAWLAANPSVLDEFRAEDCADVDLILVNGSFDIVAHWDQYEDDGLRVGRIDVATGTITPARMN